MALNQIQQEQMSDHYININEARFQISQVYISIKMVKLYK